MVRLTTGDGYPPRRGLRTIAAHLAPPQGERVRLPLRTAGAASGDAPSVLSNREEALYALGEKVVFQLCFPGHGGEDATCSITQDALMEAPAPHPPLTAHRDPIFTQRSVVCTLDADGRGEVRGSSDTPGFLQIRASTPTSPVIFAAVAIDPHLITPSLPPPDDFDDFWARQKALLAAVPMNLRMRPVPSDRPEVEVFDVQADSVGDAGVSAFLARPRSAAPRSLPAILVVHGAGVRSAERGHASHFAHHRSVQDWAAGGEWSPPADLEGWDPGSASNPPGGAGNSTGALAVNLNAHGLPNGREPSFYEGLAAGIRARYDPAGEPGWGDRESNYFVGMFLRLVRAIDVIAAQPEWDGRTLCVLGSSQGGAQAIAAAGLDARVSFFAAGVPAMCDHTGPLAEPPRRGGWPRVLELAGAGSEPSVESIAASLAAPAPEVVEAARYFDCVNFAATTAAPSAWSSSFVDMTCAPCTIYAAYNALRNGEKSMHHDPAAGHENTYAASAALQRAALDHFAAQGHE